MVTAGRPTAVGDETTFFVERLGKTRLPLGGRTSSMILQGEGYLKGNVSLGCYQPRIPGRIDRFITLDVADKAASAVCRWLEVPGGSLRPWGFPWRRLSPAGARQYPKGSPG